jgi:hypothetical protein
VEFFENVWVQVWLGVGFCVAVAGYFFDNDVYMQKKSEFADPEFSVGMFLIFVFIGPVAIPYLLFQFIVEIPRSNRIEEENRIFYEEMRLKQKEQAIKDKERKEQQKKESIDFVSENVERLLKKSESSEIEDALDYLKSCIELGKNARRLNLSDISDDNKLKIIAICRAARIKAPTLLEDLDPKKQEKITKDLTANLSQLSKNYKKTLGQK